MWLETDTCDLNALVEPKNSPIKRMIKDNYKPMRHSEKIDRWVIQTHPDWTKQHLDHDKEWVTPDTSASLCRHNRTQSTKTR